MTYQTSGPLPFTEVKGLHHVDDWWWIDTGWEGQAFRLEPYNAQDDRSFMDQSGRLWAAPGYLWDGSSGPTIDGKADPAPSLVHDLLYEALRAGKLPPSARRRADALYRALLRERGMGAFRAGLRYWGLWLFGGFAASRTRGPQYPKRLAK